MAVLSQLSFPTHSSENIAAYCKLSHQHFKIRALKNTLCKTYPLQRYEIIFNLVLSHSCNSVLFQCLILHADSYKKSTEFASSYRKLPLVYVC